jgi:hypothetical protein
MPGNRSLGLELHQVRSLICLTNGVEKRLHELYHARVTSTEIGRYCELYQESGVSDS